jgi:hypothetical protein
MTFGPGVPWATYTDEQMKLDKDGKLAQERQHRRQDELAAKARARRPAPLPLRLARAVGRVLLRR